MTENIFVLFVLLFTLVTSAQAAVSVRIAPDIVRTAPDKARVESCLPFGAGLGAGTVRFDDGAVGFPGTSPFGGFIYRNVPKFDLSVADGDLLSFDLGALNDADVMLDIAMAPATENGSLFEDKVKSFTTVVTNAQTPTNPRGDEEAGNYEMQFPVDADFSFPGGGLIIRFSNASESFREDLTCDESQVLVVSGVSAEVQNKNTYLAPDLAGYFVSAFFSDADGSAPFGPFGDGATTTKLSLIGGFEIIEPDVGNLIMISDDYGNIVEETFEVGNIFFPEQLTVDTYVPLFGTLPGDTIHYRVRIQNPQTSGADAVDVLVDLDDALGYIDADQSQGAFTPPADASNVLIWNAGPLAAGEQAEIDIEITLPGPPGTTSSTQYTNTAGVTNVTGATFTGPLKEVTSMTPLGRLHIINDVIDDEGVNVRRENVNRGDTVIYRLLLSNPLDQDAQNVRVVSELGAGLEFVTVDETPAGTDDPVYDPDFGTVTWEVGTLAEDTADEDSDDTAQALISVRVPDDAVIGSTFNNRSNITIIDAPFVPSNEVFWNFTVFGVLSVDNEALDLERNPIDEIIAGTDFIYRVTLSNAEDVAAMNVEATFEGQATYEIVDWQTSVGTATLDPDDELTLTWETGTINSQDNAELEVTVHVPLVTAPESVIQSVSRITKAETFSRTNRLSMPVTVLENPDAGSIALAIEAIDLNGNELNSVAAGRSFIYQVTATNNETFAAANAEFVIDLPDAFTIDATSSAPVGTITPDPADASLLTWILTDIPSDSSAELTITMTVPEQSEVGSTAVINAELTSVDEPFLPGDPASLTLTISSLAQDLLDQAASGNCFIATAAYGSYLEPEVVLLRRFRDRYLLTHEPGQSFVDWYYRTSPPFAAWIAQHDVARQITRWLLTPLVYAIKYPLPSCLLLALVPLTIRQRREWLIRSTS